VRSVRSPGRACGDAATFFGDANAYAAALHLELAHLSMGEALEQLGDEGVRVSADLSVVGHQAASRRMTSATLCPPKPIEFESDRSTFAFRARFGT